MAINNALENNKPIYIPRKYDKIDLALANFLNEYRKKDSLKINFLQESHGLYRFGSKRVKISVQTPINPEDCLEKPKIFAIVGDSMMPLL